MSLFPVPCGSPLGWANYAPAAAPNTGWIPTGYSGDHWEVTAWPYFQPAGSDFGWPSNYYSVGSGGKGKGNGKGKGYSYGKGAAADYNNQTTRNRRSRSRYQYRRDAVWLLCLLPCALSFLVSQIAKFVFGNCSALAGGAQDPPGSGHQKIDSECQPKMPGDFEFCPQCKCSILRLPLENEASPLDGTCLCIRGGPEPSPTEKNTGVASFLESGANSTLQSHLIFGAPIMVAQGGCGHKIQSFGNGLTQSRPENALESFVLDTKNADCSDLPEEWFLDPLGLGVHTDLDTPVMVASPKLVIEPGRGCGNVEMLHENQDGLHISFSSTKKATILGQGASQDVEKSETPLGLGDLSQMAFSQAPVEKLVSTGGQISQDIVGDHIGLGAYGQIGCSMHTGKLLPPISPLGDRLICCHNNFAALPDLSTSDHASYAHASLGMTRLVGGLESMEYVIHTPQHQKDKYVWMG